jgi:ribosomal protein L12E/L44/L45/RPP1/RPP2
LSRTKGILIVDLDNPYDPPRFIRYRIGFEVADVQWSPFASRAEWIASTNNNKAIIFNLNLKPSQSEAPIDFTLDAHQGNITDINFSAHHPDVLATCALDTYVFTWDLRAPMHAASSLSSLRRAPSISFADWKGGATQVKWNRNNEHILASSHDRYVQVWDVRHGARPISTIHAHFNKVYGIDWHRSDPNKLLTCSLDKTVKQWDGVGIAADIASPTRTILTDYPLLRARHTPFPNGIMTMPQRGSASLGLYAQTSGNPSIDLNNEATHVFNNGAVDIRLHEFLWRSRGGYDQGFDHRDFQLITWATDRQLRLHKVTSTMLEQAVGFKKGGPTTEEISKTRMGAQYITFRDGPVASPDTTRADHSQTALPRQGALSSLFQNVSTRTSALASRFTGEPQRATMTARSVRRDTSRRVTNNVTWLHNVNIDRKTVDADGRVSEHETPDIHDPYREIADVTRKFGNVEIEDPFDRRSREAMITFRGPWGDVDTTSNQNQLAVRKPVFLRFTIRFPEKYPEVEKLRDDAGQVFGLRMHPLEFTFERTTAAIAPAMVDHLKVSLERISKAYAAEARPALEPVLSYALGDRDLEEIIDKAQDSDPARLAPAPESEPRTGAELSQGPRSSSEEDEDSETGEFTNDLMHSSHSNANIPLPAQTTVRFSNPGFLVTVSLPRAGLTMSSSSIFLSDPVRISRHLRQTPSKDDIFDTFGRITTGHGSDSPTSSLVSWESSSSPSSSSESGIDAHMRFQNFLPPLPWQKVSSRLHTKASVPSSVGPTNPNRTKSIVAILDSPVAEFVPSKRFLAEDYLVFGDGPAVCLHNSEVARRHGLEDIADIWQLCKLILNNEVPLDILPQQRRREQVLVLARRAIVRIKRKDSGLDLQFDEADAVANPKLKGRVKWGHHTVVTWLIPALFDHFERLADTQMLAMLSCVFSEPAAREGVTSAMAKMRQSHLPMSMEAPAFSLDYFPSADSAWSLFNPTISLPTTPAHSKYATPIHEFGWHRLSKNLDTYGSHGSSNGPWGSDTLPSEPVTPYSTGNTPPTLSRAPTYRSTTTSQTPYGTSPEQSQTVAKKMSSSGFSNALATLGRTLVSSSPPVKSRIEDLSTSAPASGVTWGTTTFYSSGSNEKGLGVQRSKHGKRASFGQAEQLNIDYISDSDSEYDIAAPDGASEYTAPLASGTEDGNDGSRIKITLKNQDKFDEEGCVSAPLLDMSKEWLHRAWREQYAEMLGCWGLVSKRAEVLKFNGLVSYFPTGQTSREPSRNGSKAGSIHLGLKKEGAKNEPAYFSQTLSRASTLAPPAITTSQFKQSPMSSPRNFSFNPEALEFRPGNSFTPVDELPAPPADVFISSEQYLRLSIPTPSIELPTDPFTMSFDGAAESKLSPYASRRLSRPSISRGASNISSRVPTPSNNSPQKIKTSEPIYSCGICWIRVSGRFYLCPGCLHVAHFECLDDEIGVEEGECVVGCGCGCGFESDEERDRIEEFIEGVRWEERGGWLPEVEFDEDASTKNSKALEADAERRRGRVQQEVGPKKAGKPKGKKKTTRVSGLSYY